MANFQCECGAIVECGQLHVCEHTRKRNAMFDEVFGPPRSYRDVQRSGAAEPSGVRRLVPAYRDATGRLYLGVTHAQALEAAEALGATIPADSCGGWLMSNGTYEPQATEAPAHAE